MNFLPGLLPVVLYCFLYLHSTSCRPLELIPEQKLDQELQPVSTKAYQALLLAAIPAASAGKNLFSTQQNISEDCVRTARVIMEFFYKPSTTDLTGAIISDGLKEAVTHKTATSTFRSLVEKACQNLDEAAKKEPLTFLNFEQLKKNVQVPRPEKNYIIEFPAKNNAISVPYDDPEMIKNQIVSQLIKLRLLVPDKNLQKTIRAIYRLADKHTYKTTVDKVFLEALDDFVKNLPTQGDDKFQQKNMAHHSSLFVEKVDQYLLNNQLLKEEYTKMKAMD